MFKNEIVINFQKEFDMLISYLKMFSILFFGFSALSANAADEEKEDFSKIKKAEQYLARKIDAEEKRFSKAERAIHNLNKKVGRLEEEKHKNFGKEGKNKKHLKKEENKKKHLKKEENKKREHGKIHKKIKKSKKNKIRR